MDRHAYMIMAHGSFGLLQKLLTALDDERNDIFVHVDANAGEFPKADLHTSRAGLYFTPERIKGHWGGTSLIMIELLLLKTALMQGTHSYYHLLSGCDLPIKSQDEIHAFFAANAGSEFVSFWKKRSSTKSRFLYCPLPEHRDNFFCNILNCTFMGVQLLLHTGQRKGVDYRFGSQWFSITESLARYVVSREEWIRETFRNRCLCDEIFMQTVVWSSPFREKCYITEEEAPGSVSMSNLRFIDWSRGESHRHPWTFDDNDYDLLRSIPQLFARKFAQGTAIVDRITRYE